VTEVYQLQPSLATLETFSYDDVGNRTADVDYNDYTYNSNNQLTAYDSIVLEYDKNGNLTKKTEGGTDVTTYTFDYENRLVRIDYPDETYSAYKYDPSGRRIEVRFRDGDIRRYYYDNHDLLAAYDGSNNFLAAAVYGPGIDQAISIFRNGQNYYYHADALGSIYQMTDSGQNVVKEYDYSAFGKIISESGSLPFENPITYTGREYDSDSGLYYYRARYYDAGAGRFLSRDPINSVNLYVYVLNNPLAFMDPVGLWCIRFGTDTEEREVSWQPWGPYKLYGIAEFIGFASCLYKRTRLGSQYTKSRTRYLCYDTCQGLHFEYGGWKHELVVVTDFQTTVRKAIIGERDWLCYNTI